MRFPSATYRLQLNRQLTFADAAELIPYLDRLGVSHTYLSPVSRARPGSVHGYDVIDHGELNPELGGEEQFQRLATALGRHGLGVLLDVVPNHMCIAGHWNWRWLDVLENGPSAESARFFDIDWRPPKPELNGKVLLPVLGEQYGRVLEEGIAVCYDAGAFFITFNQTRLPLAPRTWPHILEPALAELRTRFGDEEPRVLELESIIRAIGHLPHRTESAPARRRERRHEREIIGQRLAALVAKNGGAVREAIERSVEEISGRRGEPRSFDRLEALLADQAYRLSHWRVAADEINYRRFFDINDLAAVRVEDPVVFQVVHELPLSLVRRGVVTGFRIDHVDGLYDPEKYLRDLQRCFRDALQGGAESTAGYVVVEKILAEDEPLPAEWPVHGTTGYDFLNQISAVLVDDAGVRKLKEIAGREGIIDADFSQVVYESKKLVLASALSAELTVLARRLDRISEQQRYTRDFTRNGLLEALGEVVACFPVYRTYIRPGDTGVSERDRHVIEVAIRSAKRRNPVVNESLFDFVRRVLLLEIAEPTASSEAERAEQREFVLRFQQITGPVMAKGLEDTAFYRYFPLAALAEVGGDPSGTGISVAEFHRRNRERAARSPHGLNATATHDTKRGEDTRARLLALSEIPQVWADATARWRYLLTERRGNLSGVEIPAPAEENLFFQTLLGAWPIGGLDERGWSEPEFPQRIRDYMGKALLEAKVNTSWINRNEGYEAAVDRFVQAALDPGRSRAFLDDFSGFQTRLRRPGYYTALAQLLLKLACPGVPDFYQGTELWDLALVDPDNRRPVDWARRRAHLEVVLAEAERDPAGLADRLLAQPEDGRLKLFVLTRGLHLRRARGELFERGAYEGLITGGPRAAELIALARSLGSDVAIALCGRHFTRICERDASPVGPVWKDTTVRLPEGLAGRRFRDVLTGRTVVSQQTGTLPVAETLLHLPVALLTLEPERGGARPEGTS
jgi:(1->4)-alpha-D-glucan 1-alpha-D-glucosylmutase